VESLDGCGTVFDKKELEGPLAGERGRLVVKEPRACRDELDIPPTCCCSAQEIDAEISITLRYLDQLTSYFLLQKESVLNVGARGR
jgi:hypothetical protein